MKRILKLHAIASLLFCLIFSLPELANAQQPNATSGNDSKNFPGVYLLSITPKSGGKSYTLFHRTKVQLTMNDGREIKGKVRGVSQNEISIEYKSYPIDGISEIRFSPGSSLGLVAAGAMLVGVTMVAVAGPADSRSSSEETIFWGGIGLAAAGFATLIPTYFMKKKFSANEYEFTSVLVAGY